MFYSIKNLSISLLPLNSIYLKLLYNNFKRLTVYNTVRYLNHVIFQILLPLRICKKNGPLALQELRISLGQE